ncbi:hypothetical protein HNR23_004475 [Nocardiopsis mwathae]|uniref:Uncharacterized protein n=1 Tax=Nocardiopsis mwathae TaxID=1472723 RepID=A0A7W9YLK2_9ACTN|nr:hypothetical protein [Nocardiopsis mwathae]
MARRTFTVVGVIKIHVHGDAGRSKSQVSRGVWCRTT